MPAAKVFQLQGRSVKRLLLSHFLPLSLSLRSPSRIPRTRERFQLQLRLAELYNGVCTLHASVHV